MRARILFAIICAVTTKQQKNKKTKTMKITGLKVVSIKEWKISTKFTASDGRLVDVPANQKLVCMDEKGDIVNLSIITDKPLTITLGKVIDVSPENTIKHSAFGWEGRATLI